jgi:hypothetical protein
MIIIMVSGKTQPERFYVILRRSGTKKNKGDISPNSREISPKRKKSIDLETVVFFDYFFSVRSFLHIRWTSLKVRTVAKLPSS